MARVELELELIQTHMVQKPMLRVEGGKRCLCAWCACLNRVIFLYMFYYSPAPYASQNIHPHCWPFAQGLSLLIINYDFYPALIVHEGYFELTIPCFYRKL